MNNVAYLIAEDILNIHSVIVSETGGSHGVRDDHAIRLLEDLPRQAAFGRELYPTLFLKAAIYIRTIAFNHPFLDGNKRTAMGCADVFLHLNGYQIAVPAGGVEKFAISVVTDHLELDVIAAWLKKQSRPIGG